MADILLVYMRPKYHVVSQYKKFSCIHDFSFLEIFGLFGQELYLYILVFIGWTFIIAARFSFWVSGPHIFLVRVVVGGMSFPWGVYLLNSCIRFGSKLEYCAI